MELITIASISIFAYTFSEILNTEILSFYHRKIEHLPVWIAKPLGMCSKCLGGQIAFWYYIYDCFMYDILEHIIYTFAVIFLTHTISIIYERIENR